MGRMYLLSYLLVAVIQNIAIGRPADDIESHHIIKRRGLIEDFLNYLDYIFDYDYEYYDSDESDESDDENKKPAACPTCNILINVANLLAAPANTTTSITSTPTMIPTMTVTTTTTTTPTTPIITGPPTNTAASLPKIIFSPHTRNASNLNIGDAIIGEKGLKTLDTLRRRRPPIVIDSISYSDDYNDLKKEMEAFLGIPDSSVDVGKPAYTEESTAGPKPGAIPNPISKPEYDNTLSGPDIFERDVEAVMKRLASNEKNGLTNDNNKGFAMDLEGAGDAARNQEAVMATRGSFIRLGEADVIEGVQEVPLADPTIRRGNDEIVEKDQKASITTKGAIVAAGEVNKVERTLETPLNKENTMVVKVDAVKENQEPALNGGNAGIQSPVIRRADDKIDQTNQKGPIVATGHVGIVQSDQKMALDGKNTMIKEPEIVKGENDETVKRDQEKVMTSSGPMVVTGGGDLVKANQEAALNKGNTGIQKDPVVEGGIVERVQKTTMDAKAAITEMDPTVNTENKVNVQNDKGQ